MINQLQISGYKCLQATPELKVKALNVLVGTNASGKSSLLQTLLLLRQSINQAGEIESLHLSGALYEGGTGMDVVHPGAEHKLSFALTESGQRTSFDFRFDRDDGSKRRQLVGQRKETLAGALGDRNGGFAYLNAERLGPRVSYPLPPDDVDFSGLVGKHGEYTTGLLAKETNVPGWTSALAEAFATAQQQLDAATDAIREELVRSQGRLDLVSNLVLNWIIPGAQFDATENDNLDSAPLRFVRDPSSTKVMTRATHVGFGLAYALPVIAAGLSLNSDGLLIVENPEAHLHPFSQSRMGAFLALLASTGRQVFVETHSDHVVNGIRLAIRFGLMHSTDVVFNHFSHLGDEQRSEIHQIESDSDGALDEWPAGFFDQIERDLARL